MLKAGQSELDHFYLLISKMRESSVGHRCVYMKYSISLHATDLESEVRLNVGSVSKPPKMMVFIRPRASLLSWVTFRIFKMTRHPCQ